MEDVHLNEPPAGDYLLLKTWDSLARANVGAAAAVDGWRREEAFNS